MIDDQVTLRDMPPPQYLALHPEARFAESDLAALSEWALHEQERLSNLASRDRKQTGRPRATK